MPRGGGGPCSGGVGAGLARRGCACGCGSHASSCDGERWAGKDVSWGRSREGRVGRADRLRRGHPLVKGETGSRKRAFGRERLPSGRRSPALAAWKMLVGTNPLPNNDFRQIRRRRRGPYGAFCRSCRPLEPLHILAPCRKARRHFPRVGSLKARRVDGGSGTPGCRFSTVVDRSVENAERRSEDSGGSAFPC